MSRSRSISTEISTDERLGPLGEENPLSVLLYTLAIPHADDWGRLKGDATAFRYEVAPFLLVPASQIDAALESIAAAGLWVRYEVDGRKFIAFPRDAWFKHQSYINVEKRTHDGSKIPPPPGEIWESWESRPSAKPKPQSPPRNAKNHQESPENPISPSPSPSPTPSPSCPPTPVEHEVQTTAINGKVFSESDTLPIHVQTVLGGCPDWWEAHLRIALCGRAFQNPAALSSYATEIIRGWKKGKNTPTDPVPQAKAYESLADQRRRIPTLAELRERKMRQFDADEARGSHVPQ